MSIPVLDISGFVLRTDKASVARDFGRALEDIGFVVITGHGVPEPLITETYRAVSAFFELPSHVKQACAAPEKVKARGYLAVGIESVAATLTGETPPDLCEALVFASIQRERAGLGQPNLWPQQPPELTALVNRYFDAMLGLCHALMRLSALALDLPERYFEGPYAEPSLTLRFVNYPDQPVPPLPGQLRYGAHHDYGGLTIVRQDDAPGGLQACDRGGRWHDVPAIPGGLTINVGDLMARWTNDRWRSTLHRVINPPRELTGSTRRLSMVAFTGPSPSTEIVCLPSCIDAEHPARYAPVRTDDYIQAKLRRSMDLTEHGNR